MDRESNLYVEEIKRHADFIWANDDRKKLLGEVVERIILGHKYESKADYQKRKDFFIEIQSYLKDFKGSANPNYSIAKNVSKIVTDLQIGGGVKSTIGALLAWLIDADPRAAWLLYDSTGLADKYGMSVFEHTDTEISSASHDQIENDKDTDTSSDRISKKLRLAIVGFCIAVPVMLVLVFTQGGRAFFDDNAQIRSGPADSIAIGQAWARLTNKSSSNGQRKEALQFLFDKGESFEGVDLSCETLGLGWDEATFSCDRPIDLSDIDMKSPSSLPLLYNQKRKKFPLGSGPQISTPANIDKAVSRWSEKCLAKAVPKGSSNRYQGGLSAGLGLSENPDFSEPLEALRKKVRSGGANFRGAKLSGIRFGFSNLSGANFENADLRGALMDQTIIEAGKFDDADTRGMVVIDSFLMGSTFGLNRRKSIDYDPLYPSTDTSMATAENHLGFRVEISWLDGSVLEFGQFGAGLAVFRNSRIRNTVLDLFPQNYEVADHKHCMFKFGDGGVDEWMCGKQQITYRQDVLNSDLTCSTIWLDKGLNLSESNISNVRFLGYGDENKTRFSPSNFARFPNYRLAPWAWSDLAPTGPLHQEKIIKCDPADNRTESDLLSSRRVPNSCILEKSFGNPEFEIPYFDFAGK